MRPPSPRRRQRRAGFGLLLAAVCLPASGCCDLALYLCGPDRSHWVPISYRTPPEAIATFLEAIRREHVRIIYESLSEQFKVAHGLPGLLEAELAWQRLREQQPGIHLLGSAEVGAPVRLADDRCRFELEVAGRGFFVELQRRPFLSVSVDRGGALTLAGESYVDDLRSHVAVRGDDLESVVTLSVPVYEAVDPDRVLEVVGGHDWKVDALGPIDGRGGDDDAETGAAGAVPAR